LWLREWPGLHILPTTNWAKQAAIYSTVALEILGPLLLWPRLTRGVGLGLLWLFALGLSSNTRAVYFEFMGWFWACSLVWLDPCALRGTADELARVGAQLASWLPGARPHNRSVEAQEPR
jgi:hypothetical protein